MFKALLMQQGSTALQDTHSTLPLELLTGTGGNSSSATVSVVEGGY